MEDILLYHGSKKGIDGNIKPCSRETTDFGRGFYMGDNVSQAKAIVKNEKLPKLYTVNFRLSEIPESRILKIDKDDWLCVILANRNKLNAIKEEIVFKELKEKIEQYDVIIGPIADDNMNIAFSSFLNGSLTDIGLYESLRKIDLGTQYVAKTEFACSKIDIISQREILLPERNFTIAYDQQCRKEKDSVVFQMKEQYENEGIRIFSYLKKIQNKEFPSFLIRNQEKYWEEDYEK